MTETKNDNYVKGILFILLAALGFGFMSFFVRLSGDLPSVEKSFFRNLVAIFFAFLAMKKGKITFSIPKGSEKYIFFRSLLERSGSLQTFMRLGNCILRMHQCLINYLPFLPLSFPISC